MFKKVLVSLAASCVLWIATVSAGEKIVVIVNVSNTQTIDAKFVKNVYSDIITTWNDGKKIKTFDLPVNSEVREFFSQTILGMSAKNSAREWSNRKITNTAKNPPRTKKAKFVATAVSMNKNAMGYVPESLVAGKKGVKIIMTVD